MKAGQSENEFEYQRRKILLDAKLVFIDLIYYNSLKAEYTNRLENARKLADSYQARFDKGEVGILEVNKARVNLLNISKEAETLDIDRNLLLADLRALNGGKPIDISGAHYPVFPAIPSFDEWLTRAEQGNPMLSWYRQQIAISEEEVRLNHSMALPKFGAGYMSEKVAGQKYQGLTIGLTIPLMENKNTVRFSKARTTAYQGAENDARLQFYSEMQALYEKVTRLRESVNDYRANLSLFSNDELLRKALDLGEISLAEYLYEITIYYDGRDKMMEMERDLYRAWMELMQYEQNP
jgi:outer membrane protein TolC